MNTWNVQPANTKQLAALYEVTTRIFRKWIKPFSNEIGERTGIYFTVRQVELIIDKLGLPPRIEIIYNPSHK